MALKQLREMLDRKEISAVELTQEYLDKIASRDKAINSYITVCPDSAIEAAKRLRR